MRMQALRAGAVEFLAKPFDEETLLESVRVALES
jgi:FixJ family two-component response regulator